MATSALTEQTEALTPTSSVVLQKGEVDQAPGAYVPKSWLTDPFALLDSLGLGYQSSPSSLSFTTLRRMSEQSDIVCAIIQTRVHQVASFCRPQPNRYSIGFRIHHKDANRKLTEGEVNFIKSLEDFIENCGTKYNDDRDSYETYVKKLVRSRLTYDQICTEVVSRYNGKPYEFLAVPAETIRLASPKHRKGTPLRRDEVQHDIKYVQVIDGAIANTYTPREMIFSVANPRAELRAWNYGYSELEMLIKTVTSHLWAEEWNRRVFSQGTTAKGLLNIRGNIPPNQLEAFKRQWLTQVSGVSNAWRTPILNTNDDVQWISLQPTNEEMGYEGWMTYLIKMACAIYLIDPAEINFDIRGGPAQKAMFMSTNEAQQKVSQDRGLRPLLRHIEMHTNRIITRIDPDYEMEFVGLDAKTEEDAIELRLKELSSYKTLNEVRAREQLPPVPYGDIVPNPSYIGYRNQKEMAAMQQQAAGAQNPLGGGTEGTPGFPTAGNVKPGQVEAGVRQAMDREMGNKPSEKKVKEPEPDRYRSLSEEEEWESTYNASIRRSDLRKAVGPFDDLLR